MSLWIVPAICVSAAAVSGLLALRRFFVVINVTGQSMIPAFREGDRLLLRRGAADRIRTGTVVVLRPPHKRAMPHNVRVPGFSPPQTFPWAVKRVAALPGDTVPESVRLAVGGALVVPEGMIVVLADNPHGADSRIWGFVPVGDMLGLVVRQLSPNKRNALQPNGR
jgi:signal peptidase I